MKKKITAIVAVIMFILLSFNVGAYAEVPYSFKDAPSTAEIGETVNFTVTRGTDSLASKDFTWSVSPVGSAIVKNGCVTFLNSGDVTVKATNTSGTVQTTVKVSRTAYTKEGSLNYNFTTALAMNRFDANFVPDNTGIGAGNEEWQNHWELNTDKGYVERINDLNSSDVSKNITSLYFKNTKMSCFDVTAIYQNVTGGNGWFGVVSNNNDLTKRGIDNGLASFVQSNGRPTFWGLSVGSAVRQREITDYYGATDWHVVRVRMTQYKVEMYIDDLQTVSYEYNLITTPVEGNIGIMVSGGYRIKHIRASYLQKNGEKIPYNKVESLTVSEKPTTATVGQTVELTTTVAPSNATVKGYTMTSTDSNVCIAKNGKLVFIAEGTITVSIVSDDNPSIKEEWQIQVKANPEQGKPGSGSYYVKDGGNTTGGGSTSGGGRLNVLGIALTTVFSVVTLAGAGTIVALLLLKKKR